MKGWCRKLSKSKKVRSLEKMERCEYIIKLDTERDLDKFIKRVERLVRSSLEYRDIMAFLRQNVDFDKCAFFNHVSKEENKKIRIEIHHDPLTLYDITRTVLQKYIQTGLPVDDLYIAEEVMELHYVNMVGLIPLSKTIHQVVHKSDKIIIPIHMCYGNYQKFLDIYGKYLEDDDPIWDKIEHRIEDTKKLRQQDYDPLVVEFTYLDIDGFEVPQRLTNDETESTESTNERVA